MKVDMSSVMTNAEEINWAVVHYSSAVRLAISCRLFERIQVADVLALAKNGMFSIGELDSKEPTVIFLLPVVFARSHCRPDRQYSPQLKKSPVVSVELTDCNLYPNLPQGLQARRR